MAKEKDELTWEDIVLIDTIMTDISTEREHPYGRKFYEEVLRRFNEQLKKLM